MSTVAAPHAVAVQPLDVFVTVTQYVLPVVTVIDDVVAPPGLHKYVTPPDPVAVRVREVFEQVIEPLAPTLTVGLAVSTVAAPQARASQPFAVLVTVTQ